MVWWVIGIIGMFLFGHALASDEPMVDRSAFAPDLDFGGMDGDETAGDRED